MIVAAVIALLLLAAPSCLAVESVSVELDGEARGMFADAEAIASRISSYLELHYDAESESRITVYIAVDAGAISVATTFAARGKPEKSLTSTLPAGAVGSLIPTVCGDIAYLRCSSLGFPESDLGRSPPLLDRLSETALGRLTGWSAADLEPIGIASRAGDIVLCFPRRYLTLGRGFAVTQETLSDMIFQEKGDPLLFSGIAAAVDGRVILLSERGGKTVTSLSRLGRREVFDAPGVKGPLAQITGSGLAVVGGSTLTLYPLGGGTAPGEIALPSALVSAFTVDGEGNLWLFDAGQRRIRVCSAAGVEIHSIKPRISPSVMPLPQSLAAYPDGSFIMGGSGEIWKFTNFGKPVWRLRRIPGARQETLPAAFALAVDAADGSFYVLDAPSRRVLRFAGDAGGGAGAGESVLARADSMIPEALDRELAAQKATRSAELVDSLILGLSYDRADAVCAAALELARQYRVKFAADAAASRLHDSLTVKKRTLAGIAAEREIPAVTIFEPTRSPLMYPECGASIRLTVIARNTGKEPLENLRISVAIPGVTASPEMVLFASLGPQEERSLPVSFEPASGGGVRGKIASVLAVFSKKKAEKTAFQNIEIIGFPSSEAPLPDAAELACAALPLDPLLTLLAGDSKGIGEDPLESTASILGSLGVLRGHAARREAGFSGSVRDVRRTLRELSGGSEDWVVFTASLAANRGLESGVLVTGDTALALVQTDVRLVQWQPVFSGRPEYWDVLLRLSRDGKIVLPLSGHVSPAADPAACLADSILTGIDALLARKTQKESIYWLDMNGKAAAPSPGVPFPIAFPSAFTRISRDAVAGSIGSMLKERAR
jgi:hypothetical protein